MNLKKSYYQLKKEEFDALYSTVKMSRDSVHLLSSFGKDYFYYPDAKTLGRIIKLHDLEHKFDNLFYSFTGFGQNQILQSYLIDEILSTSEIEGILSTKHDIFYVLKTSLSLEDKRVAPIVKKYMMMLNDSPLEIKTLGDIRGIYDSLLEGAIKEEERPDGRYFRKGEVSITDGAKDVHHGLTGETNIEQAMEEYLALINDVDVEIYQRIILSHFVVETIHPYYDGNGRLGRFLMSSALYKETESPFAFLLSKSINSEKGKYYRSFKEAREFHQFGNINAYVDEMLDIFELGLQIEIKNLETKKEEVASLKAENGSNRSEDIVYSLLSESSILSDFGLSNEEISSYSGLSKREVIYCLNSLREKGLLEERKVGRYTFRRAK